MISPFWDPQQQMRRYMVVIHQHMKAKLRPFAQAQKRKLILRVVNPARYCLELIFFKFSPKWPAPRTSTGKLYRIAIVSDDREFTSETQLHPFSEYRAELRKELGVVSVQIWLPDVLIAPKVILQRFDIVILKMSYRTPSKEALRIAQILRRAITDGSLFYFDGDDDVCIQWTSVLALVDLYVKKHVFSKRTDYLKRYMGKSNLHDYAYHNFAHRFSPRDYGDDKTIMESGPIAEADLSKIFLGYNLALDSKIVRLYKEQKKAESSTRPIDIVFRGTIPDHDIWLYPFRRAFEVPLAKLAREYVVVSTDKRVSQDDYYHELISSKICVSPFGYGEICWRDFEAVICGCLLIKPDVQHIKTIPDIFIPYKTYVPVNWALSDIEEKCRYYLNNHAERELIIAGAYKALSEFYDGRIFLNIVSRMVATTGDLSTSTAGRK